MKTNTLNYCCLFVLLLSCAAPTAESTEETKVTDQHTAKSSLTTYADFELSTDMSLVSENEKVVLALLIKAAQRMDNIFWQQAYGDKAELMKRIDSEELRAFAEINYGPWDRLNADEAFVSGIGEKPKGANFYPTDMDEAEFESFAADDKKSLYTIVRRDEKGALKTIPYSEAYEKDSYAAADYLKRAADITEDPALEKYLDLRAKALIHDDFDASDIAWLDMKDNHIDIIIGPIENYEDKLFGYKAAHEAYVLVKDMAWSKRLERYVAFLPSLQEGLPVEAKYKMESPGRDSQLNAYDVVYYAGDCNSGSKTIAVNLPNDEEIQTSKGTRRSQLKNAMRAKYDKILVLIADELIDPAQRKHITFDAFFGNTMFHEVAHGLGIKNTINGKGTVREALKDTYSPLEEGKADILGLYMVTELFGKNEIPDGELMDNYVTFLAGIFRSVRFGASSAHGQANMLRFNYFQEMGAFTRNEETGTYSVDMENMKKAMTSLSAVILQLQGDGDLEGVKKLMAEKGKVGPELQSDLDRLSKAGIPVDVVFEQGIGVLGLDDQP